MSLVDAAVMHVTLLLALQTSGCDSRTPELHWCVTCSIKLSCHGMHVHGREGLVSHQCPRTHKGRSDPREHLGTVHDNKNTLFNVWEVF